MEIQPSLIKKIVIGILIIIAFFIFNPIVLIGSGQRGVLTQFGKVSDKVYGEGISLKLPIRDKITSVSVQTQTVKFDNQKAKGDSTEQSSLFAASKDLQDVQIAIVVNYHQDALKVNKIYQQYGSEKNYQSSIIEPIIRETVKSIASNYTAEELVTKRADLTDNISKALSNKFTEKNAIFERVNITNFQFSDSFNKAIESKVTAEQDALAAKNKLEQVKFEAEQRVTTATAEAQAIKIQSEAIQQSGGANYVNLKAIEKWNGVLPIYEMGGSTSLINLPAIK